MADVRGLHTQQEEDKVTHEGIPAQPSAASSAELGMHHALPLGLQSPKSEKTYSRGYSAQQDPLEFTERKNFSGDQKPKRIQQN